MATQKPTVMVDGVVENVCLYDDGTAYLTVFQVDEPWEDNKSNKIFIPTTTKTATTIFKPGTKVSVTVTRE